MFHSARLKLTAWYLLIIMAVSITFSVVIYTVLAHEVERFDRTRALRMERVLIQDPSLIPSPSPWTNPELVEETKNRILVVLVIVNSSILVISGILGFVLAGQTLAPIQEMVDEQHRFISDASHELKTPLTSLKSAFEVYLRNPDRTAHEADTVVKESITEVNKLQSLSESLLELAQYHKANGNMQFQKLSVSEVLQDAIRRVSPMAKQKKIPIDCQGKDIRIEGNKSGLVDLFVILLDNAIKYSANERAVSVLLKKQDKLAMILVKDQGAGIDKKDLPHIFDRFYRTDRARTKTAGGGYGLGLSIAKQIADVHKGRILVESKRTKGTTFTVELPIVTIS